MNVLGIDPGLKGAWAFLGQDRFYVEPFPRAGGTIDLGRLAASWRGLSVGVAVVERVGAMPGQGVVSCFTFGANFGSLLGILAALGIRTELVTPQAWKKVVLAGTAKDKDAAIAWCRQSYPAVSLIPPNGRVMHDGMADSLCLAEYGRRVYS